MTLTILSSHMIYRACVHVEWSGDLLCDQMKNVYCDSGAQRDSNQSSLLKYRILPQFYVIAELESGYPKYTVFIPKLSFDILIPVLLESYQM